MTLDTKLLLTTQFQLTFIVSTMGIMTGNAGRHLAVSRVNNVWSNRMTELSLVRVTCQAYLIGIPFQHGNLIRTMNHMTNITTFCRFFMLIQTVLMSLECIFMTFPADYYLLSFQEGFRIAGMGAMTVCATIAVPVC